MFKEKSTRKRIITAPNAKDSATLDARHQSMIERFQKRREQLAELEKTHAEIKERLAQVSIKDWNDYYALFKEDKILAEKIRRCQESTDEIEYFENTGNILFKYYEIVDNQATHGGPITAPAPLILAKSAKGRKKILPPSQPTILEALAPTPPPAAAAAAPTNVQPVIDKSTLVNSYLSAVDSSYIREDMAVAESEDQKCAECKIALTCIQQEGILVCMNCGNQEQLLVEQNRPILKAPNAKEASHLSYKRINHFKEWCAQIQGKESTEIPEEIFEQILAEIKKEKITDLKKITYEKMRDILKRQGLNKYYEHSNFILYRINGVSAPHFSPEIEEKLCNMFKDIQGPFLRHCPKDRKNFLSYSYVLSKFCSLLGLKEYLKYFPLLKSREKLYVQDSIWALICKDLGWKFENSL